MERSSIPLLSRHNIITSNHQRQKLKLISCPVALVLYSESKEEGRRKREEGLKA
ncbi:hypothetical protein [Okeania sp. SIO2B3]|uniref:hypothetical protein n=1 Tax=Okeania sp. SIO2B3 TaxID=2607784 RepID=UPI0013C0D755|nr:hypothetical protein [Okeania sp. SIO2B3]NET42171.1 hypothetical protein [Okeania sp. SIO2B3]